MGDLKDYNMSHISLDIDTKFENIKKIVSIIEEYKHDECHFYVDKNILFEYVMLAAKGSLSPKFVKEFIDTQL